MTNLFEEAFRAAATERRFGTDGSLTKPITYIAAENGLFEVRMNAVGRFARKLDGVPGMGKVQAGFTLDLPKIQWALFEKTVAFFREVMRRHGNSEAYVQLFFDRDLGKYFAHVPEQYVSGAHVRFVRDAGLEVKHVLVLEAHSHNTMGAFWSSTDDNDEKADRLFMVVGRLDERVPQVKLRWGMAGHHGELSLEEAFETPADASDQLWSKRVRPEPEPRGREKVIDEGGVLFDNGNPVGRGRETDDYWERD